MASFPNPFWTNYDQAQGAQQAIQNAQIQREAEARMQAKQQHDFAVDDLENRMRVIAMGGTQLAPGGTVDGGTLTPPSAMPAAPNVAAAAPPVAAPSAPTTTRIAAQGGDDDSAYVPAGTPGWGVLRAQPAPTEGATPAPQSTSDRIAGAQSLPNVQQDPATTVPSGPVGPLAANPSQTVTLPSGAQFQLPSAADQAQRSINATRANARAQGEGRNDAEQEDYEQNKTTLSPETAKLLGMDPGTTVDRRKLPTYIQDATNARRAQAAADQARAMQQIQMDRENETERHNRESEKISQQNANTMAERLAKIGAGGDKPATKAQFAQVEARKAQSIYKANQDYESAVNRARKSAMEANAKSYAKPGDSDYVDPQKAINDAADQYHTDLQNGQNAYENEITALGGTAQHYEYPLTRGKAQAQAAAAPAPAPAVPAPSGTPTAPAVKPPPTAGPQQPAPQQANPQKTLSMDKLVKGAKAAGISIDEARRRTQAANILITR